MTWNMDSIPAGGHPELRNMQEQRTVISPIVKIPWVLFIPHFYRRCLFKCAEQRENIRSKRPHANAISSVYAIKLFNHNRMDLNARQPPPGVFKKWFLVLWVHLKLSFISTGCEGDNTTVCLILLFSLLATVKVGQAQPWQIAWRYHKPGHFDDFCLWWFLLSDSSFLLSGCCSRCCLCTRLRGADARILYFETTLSKDGLCIREFKINSESVRRHISSRGRFFFYTTGISKGVWSHCRLFTLRNKSTRFAAPFLFSFFFFPFLKSCLLQFWWENFATCSVPPLVPLTAQPPPPPPSVFLALQPGSLRGLKSKHESERGRRVRWKWAGKMESNILA